MIIKLGRYNKIRELLIGNRTTGLQGHVHYWDECQSISVTEAAVYMGVKGCKQGTGHIQSASESGMRTGTCITTVEQ